MKISNSSPLPCTHSIMGRVGGKHCALSEKENRNEKEVVGRRMIEGTAEVWIVLLYTQFFFWRSKHRPFVRGSHWPKVSNRTCTLIQFSGALLVHACAHTLSHHSSSTKCALADWSWGGGPGLGRCSLIYTQIEFETLASLILD